MQQGGGADAGADALVVVDAIVEHFEKGVRVRLRTDTITRYRERFTSFAKKVRLARYTRRQLAGRKGKALILGYLDQHPKGSWRWLIAMLKAFWAFGLGIPFPLDVKVDIGKLPRIQREESPPDGTVKSWAEALKHEVVTYLLLIWLLISQHGWRPSHVARLKWRNVQYDSQGKPFSIIADGTREGFKTASPIATRLAPNVAEALAEWSRKTPDHLPEQNILLVQGHPLKQHNVMDAFISLRKRWNLPKLRPKDLRHWVATTCRKAGLSKQSSAFLMGHDSAAGGAMRDWYDNPQLADVFDEQSARLPGGPLGLLEPPEVKLVEGFPEEAVGLLRAYLDGQIGTMEFSGKMEVLKMKRAAKAEILTQ